MTVLPRDSSIETVNAPAMPKGNVPIVLARAGAYEARLARDERERDVVLRLRFRVFNLELHEGLRSAYATGRDRDQFDSVCDHIMVIHKPTGQVIGTYRLQTGVTAADNLGYYSEQEFDFAPYELLRGDVLELGRACVHPDHRAFEVLVLLWRGVAGYAQLCGSRYLIGCSSLSSQDVEVGSAAYHALSSCLVQEQLRTVPTSSFAFPLAPANGSTPKIPKLLRTYLAIGAQICGAPAIDRDFGTIDFLTLLDLERLASPIKARLFRC
jgi:putative hemolysin